MTPRRYFICEKVHDALCDLAVRVAESRKRIENYYKALTGEC